MVEISLLLEILAVILCLHYLYGEKFYFDKVSVGFIVIYMLCMLLINEMGIGRELSLFVYFLVVIYCGLRFGFSMKAILVNTLLYSIILGVLQAAGIIVTYLLIKPEQNEFIVALFINLFVLLIVIGIMPKIKLNKLSKILQSREVLTVVSVITTVISVVIFLLNYRRNEGFEFSHYVIFIMSVLVIGFTVIDIGKNKMKVKEKEAELRVYKMYESSFQNLIDDVRAKQHEFDNHINALYSQHFLYNTYEELVSAQKGYAKVVVSENRYNKLLSKGNHVVLGFLYGEFVECEKKGIMVDYQINIKDLKCDLPTHKLIELIGNLLKNAVDEVSNSKKEKRIKIEIIEYNGKIDIVVANNAENVDYEKIASYFRKGYSSKGSGRGFGLYNVKRICEDYNLEIVCDLKDIETIKWIKFGIVINKSL